MTALNTPLEIYKILNKSNCRKCGLPSCLAFAAAVVQGQKQLNNCPELDTERIESFCAPAVSRKTIEDEQQLTLNILLRKISEVDFSTVAERLGGVANYDKLVINCLGKDFIIDSSGKMTSGCHYNQWVHLPLLSYIIQGQGRSISREWLPFNQLEGAAAWSRFFAHRCEEDFRQLADAHTELFFELCYLFGAQEAVETDADYSLVIHPLPKLPLVIRYWVSEEDFASKLSIFFDRTAPDNLNIEYIYMITRGIVEMFRVLIVKHNMTGKLF